GRRRLPRRRALSPRVRRAPHLGRRRGVPRRPVHGSHRPTDRHAAPPRNGSRFMSTSDSPAPAPDPWRLLEEATTVLAVHAHPDDRPLATGGRLASRAAGGRRGVLVAATRGEEGEIVPGSVVPAETRPLEDVREGEIAAATSALGITQRHWLG